MILVSPLAAFLLGLKETTFNHNPFFFFFSSCFVIEDTGTFEEP